MDVTPGRLRAPVQSKRVASSKTRTHPKLASHPSSPTRAPTPSAAIHCLSVGASFPCSPCSRHPPPHPLLRYRRPPDTTLMVGDTSDACCPFPTPRSRKARVGGPRHRPPSPPPGGEGGKGPRGPGLPGRKSQEGELGTRPSCGGAIRVGSWRRCRPTGIPDEQSGLVLPAAQWRPRAPCMAWAATATSADGRHRSLIVATRSRRVGHLTGASVFVAGVAPSAGLGAGAASLAMVAVAAEAAVAPGLRVPQAAPMVGVHWWGVGGAGVWPGSGAGDLAKGRG